MSAQLLPSEFYSHPSTVSIAKSVISLPKAETEERLPFTVRIVRSELDLHKAVEVRHSAYGRHLPEFAETLRHPESADLDKGVVVLLAESKLDGAPLGTIRIQTNRYQPLTLERSLKLPPELARQTLAEATRLGVTDDRIGRVVKNVLFKAYFLYCHATGVDRMVIAGRSPIDRQYERLMFEDVYPGMGFIRLKHASNMPHRVMQLSVPGAEPKWQAAAHPLYNFIFLTIHADIDVSHTFQLPVNQNSVDPNQKSMVE